MIFTSFPVEVMNKPYAARNMDMQQLPAIRGRTMQGFILSQKAVDFHLSFLENQ
jgi:hypothetical protein